MMTRAELVERLSVERHLPLPPTPKPGLAAVPVGDDWEIVIPRDSRELQHARQLELDTAVESFNHEQRNEERRSKAAPRLVKKGMIYVAEKRPAA
jgi:hypothetical protein